METRQRELHFVRERCTQTTRVGVFFCTLKMRVLGHEKQTPLECDCRRIRPRCKQIQHSVDQVVLMIERILESRLLTHNRDELKDGSVRLILGGDRARSRRLTSSFSFRVRKASTKHLHDAGSKLPLRSSMMLVASLMLFSTFFIKIFQFSRKGPSQGITL